jgi:23S rRNA (adenine2503-C2)-methyltransferase
MLPVDLTAFLATKGIACMEAEARRVLGHVISEGRDDLRAMKKPVRALVRNAIDGHTSRAKLEVVERVTDDDDGFEKLLLRASDGALHEAVRIPLHKPGRFTVCLSSQVGCAMGCTFCATGRLGLTRNLLAHEIVAAFVAVRETLAPSERLSGAVFMGQGEPLANYDEVIQAARVLSDPCGGRVEAKAISISTVGIVPMIRRYTDEGHKFRLIISLHSALADKRRSLLPIAGAFALDDLADAIRAYQRSIHDRVTIAWCVMGGTNTGADEVRALRAMLEGVPIRLNLIDVNDARPDGFRRAAPRELARFLDELQVLQQPVVRRYSGGSKRHAACGMLASVATASRC